MATLTPFAETAVGKALLQACAALRWFLHRLLRGPLTAQHDSPAVIRNSAEGDLKRQLNGHCPTCN